MALKKTTSSDLSVEILVNKSGLLHVAHALHSF